MPALTDRIALASLRVGGYRSASVRTSVGRVHVLDARGGGRLPPVVVLHGFSASCVHYLPLLLRLRPAVRRVVAPDLPAHGFSDVPRDGVSTKALSDGLHEALDATLDEPALFVGNSMGGLAAIRYALARPERTLGLVLVSPGGAPMEAAELDDFLRRFRVQTHDEALAFVDRLFAEPTPLRHLFAWGVKRQFGLPAMRVLLRSMGPAHMLEPEHVRALRPPVLLLWGKNDRILPASHLAFFRRHLPDHAVVEEPHGFGHAPFLDDPGALSSRVLAFAEQLERAGWPARSSPR